MEQETHIEQHLIKASGRFPNNSKLPLLLYRDAAGSEEKSAFFQDHFKENQWGGSWTGGVYDYHHYHSTTHEVLGVLSGEAELIFGGPNGTKVKVHAGDMAIIPAGVSHCCQSSDDDFEVMGAYPKGLEDYDICTAEDDPEAKAANIANVPLPDHDPIKGEEGALIHIWGNRR